MSNPGFFDAHSGVPIRVLNERNLGRKKVVEKDFLKRMESGNINARFASVYVEPTYQPEKNVRRAVEQIEALKQDISESDNIAIAENISELREENNNGKTVFMISMEGAEPIQGSLRLLDLYDRLGVKMMTLTHSKRNSVGTGAYTDVGAKDRKGGLSDFGENVVQRMQELGMAIDISHLNREGFWEVMEVAEGPVVASHSNARSLCNNPRNLGDKQLKAVADRGGVVGLASGVDNFVKPENAALEDFLDHLDYMVELIGIENVGFGFDYWEYLEKYFPGDSENWGMGIEGMSDASKVSKLYQKMEERGYNEKEIRMVARENFLETLDEIFQS